VSLVEPIKIQGLAEFNRNLRKLDNDLPKALRLAHNEAADIIVDWAQPKVPRKSGKAAKTVKAKSTRTESRVQGGSTRAPYYPWLDFGGKVGPKKSVRRPFIKAGRYLYPGLGANYDRLNEVLLAALLQVAKEAGVEIET
jgi:hypothetical protein